MEKPKIGAHISIAGGILKGIERASEMEVECMQIFASTPRRYEISFPKEAEIKKIKEKLSFLKDFPIYIHANYLLNLASEDKIIYEKSLESLENTLNFSSMIEAEGVVYHPGSPKGGDKNNAIEREADSIKKILRRTDNKSFLFIENTAGKKKIGVNPKEVGLIFNYVKSSRLKVCIDTAHSLESGNIEKFTEDNIEKWLDEWNKEINLENVGLFHINDSLTDFNSEHDRHENIGEGYIGLEGFKKLMKIKKIRNIPWIIEVPGFDGKGPDKKNIDILKKIRREL